MRAGSIEIIENDNKWDFEEEVQRAIKNRGVIDIKFAVTSDVHSTGFGSYSSGETYYAMIIFE